MYKYFPLARRFSWYDLIVFSFIAMLLYSFIDVAQHWTGRFQPSFQISLSPLALPKYALFSFTRAMVGYLISFGFTLIYGYTAAKLKGSEFVLIPFLDILQSIPVFGFLPGLVIGLMAIFPNSNIGLEIACVVMLATGQAWNMVFSFYHSLKGVPKDLNEATQMMHLSWFQRLKKLELPFAAIPLAWNSLMSMAGGWFFLTVCESFTLEDKQFHLPGIGSYMATAIERADSSAMFYGVIAMFLVIFFSDFIIWRPVLAWVQKFQMDSNAMDVEDLPFVTTLLKESTLLNRVRTWQLRLLRDRSLKKAVKRFRKASRRGMRSLRLEQAQKILLMPLPIHQFSKNFIRLKSFWNRKQDSILRIISRLFTPASILLVLWGGTRVWELIRTLDKESWASIWRGVGFTGVRVFGAVILSTLWTVPFGIFIGRSSKLTRIFQPIVQLAASFPAPMLYPLVLGLMFHLGLGIRWGSMFLMLFGVQWYVLFNVLAGATKISQVYVDSLNMMGVTRWERWKKLYLPAVFPELATGWVNAAGGAWNACIVAEYIQFNSETLMAPGIGAMICRATAAADFPKLAGALLAMVVTVVLLNRILWNPICLFAEKRYR